MTSEQITALHDEGLTPAQISEQLNVSEVSVIAALAPTNPSIDFTDEHLQAAIDGIAHVAKYGDNERNRATCGMYIYDVKKGIRAPKKVESILPIAQINQLILASNVDVTRFINRQQSNRCGNSFAPEGAIDIEACDSPAPN